MLLPWIIIIMMFTISNRGDKAALYYVVKDKVSFHIDMLIVVKFTQSISIRPYPFIFIP